MANEGMPYKIEKASLVETQLKQVKQLKTNLCEIKKLNLCFFPNSMDIKEDNDYFIFYFDEENKGQKNNFDGSNNQGEKMNFYQLIGLEGQEYNEYVPYLIMRLLKLAINLNKFGIHLPMLNVEHFIQTQQPSGCIEPGLENLKQVQRIYLYKFGTEKLSEDNKDLINNNNIPNEIIQKIVQKNVQQIEFNEKMTVFSFGCIIYQVHTKNQVMENQDSQQLRHRNNIISDLDDDNSFKQLIENCTKEFPEERPNLIQVQQEYLKIFLSDKVLDLTKYKIYNLIPHIIDLKEQITGRLCIMEFLTKIKFIQLLFQKFGNIEKAQKEIIMLFLINKEKEKLKLDQNKELTLWDEDNTRDEINEFKKNYLKLYNSTLELIVDKIKKRNIGNKQFIELAIKLDDSLYNKKIQEILIQRKNLNDKSSQLNCLEHLNIIFKYRYLLDYFKPIREELITTNPDDRYDKILEILFSQNNNQEILDLSLIGKIKQKI